MENDSQGETGGSSFTWKMSVKMVHEYVCIIIIIVRLAPFQ